MGIEFGGKIKLLRNGLFDFNLRLEYGEDWASAIQGFQIQMDSLLSFQKIYCDWSEDLQKKTELTTKKMMDFDANQYLKEEQTLIGFMKQQNECLQEINKCIDKENVYKELTDVNIKQLIYEIVELQTKQVTLEIELEMSSNTIATEKEAKKRKLLKQLATDNKTKYQTQLKTIQQDIDRKMSQLKNKIEQSDAELSLIRKNANDIESKIKSQQTRLQDIFAECGVDLSNLADFAMMYYDLRCKGVESSRCIVNFCDSLKSLGQLLTITFQIKVYISDFLREIGLQECLPIFAHMKLTSPYDICDHQDIIFDYLSALVDNVPEQTRAKLNQLQLSIALTKIDQNQSIKSLFKQNDMSQWIKPFQLCGVQTIADFQQFQSGAIQQVIGLSLSSNDFQALKVLCKSLTKEAIQKKRKKKQKVLKKIIFQAETITSLICLLDTFADGMASANKAISALTDNELFQQVIYQ
ncbi:hypothetical protein RFI_16563 [Reticulomyxa filosa]|uniref:Uncharacterized protein n=1 Tax=Reticulomyxa filosa TaxID=46433 RepID=X6N301_RETFI|nr:hypothetical protein RFI_16563 [Reticulomyxa filosa]|eukprot:ETO20655.1 hypothetical protein RFI_16563 [Reticulomyxa filosa]